ncbi:hypothetical protein VIBNISO65_1540028 [Vibrio nigripulchritudo SO65]|nr:hypothetical protein VIBNIAM115_1270007 [Vibrio nigripulchritudo AM115]CCN44884.1 hypothetical protein VIBNIFTn2_980008 [Vibrio nigripulchritudo FTn2]CCN65693.1 hypothetical protein VIBNIPon4_420028 [Vibrio nigripulchritudo POn4]CCN76258.1 hypothetical protein VIBNISO65_1540028 [Vibrio nigripulchritudo SO65]
MLRNHNFDLLISHHQIESFQPLVFLMSEVTKVSIDIGI